MKKLYSLIILLTFNSLLFAQGGWVEQTSGVTVQLTSISCLGIYDLNAWICGNSGTVLRTTNRGLNWINVSGNGIPAAVSLINIFGLYSDVALTAGYISSNMYVYRTTNGGSNWAQVFYQSGGFINAISTLPNNILFMAGNPVGGRWSLWKSTNYGANWDSTGLYLPQAGTEAGWNNAMFCHYSNKIWIGSNNSRIYYSSNAGLNWTIQPTTPEVNTYTLYFTIINNFADGLIGGITLLRTSNGGLNWTPQSAPGTGNFGGITGHSYFGTHTYYVRSDNKIYSSTGLSNFNIDYTAPSGNYRHIAGYLVYGPFWAVRDNGGISFHDYFGGINRIGSEIPNKFSLHQNYPNPFNPSTTIRFDLPKSGFVKLVVYNSLGSETAVLVNENLQAGSYEYKWTAGNLSSGIYFYTLETGGFRDTKKMVVLK